MTERTIAHYKILDKLGEGGMGVVYRGVDLMLDRPVAIKSLHAHILHQPGVIERFRSEAALLARLNDPNIATLYSFFREGDEFFMVMEFINGRTLASLMREKALRGPEQSVAIINKVLSALDHAHSMGILHRDIKPANILIAHDGAVKITDFGIARALGSERLTRDLRLVGTLEYVAPERIRGEEGDLRSDLYSVGAVLYELLADRLPFEHSSDFDLMRAHLEKTPLPLRQPGLHISPVLEAIVFRALAKRPEDRFSTAKEMRDALASIDLRPVPAETRFVEPVAIAETKFVPVLPVLEKNDASRRPLFSKPAVWLGIACAAVLALVFIIVSVRADKSSSGEAAPVKTTATAPTVESQPAPPATPGPAPTPVTATPSAPETATDTPAFPPAGEDETVKQEKRAAQAKRKAAALQALDQ